MSSNPVSRKIRNIMPNLTKSEERIARYILNNEQRAGLETGASLAAATQVSEITVSRFLRKLGYRGMRQLKIELATLSPEEPVASTERYRRLLASTELALIEAESRAIMKLSSQLSRPEWTTMVEKVWASDRVFVTGFQTVRGLAEDFARRLGVVRDAVRFIAAHDGGLGEWCEPSRSLPHDKNTLIMIDAYPYAREAEKICAIARDLNIEIAVFTDEFNNWAYSYTNLVFHAETKTGVFIETTATLNSILNFALHGVAGRDPATSRMRIESLFTRMKDLGVV